MVQHLVKYVVTGMYVTYVTTCVFSATHRGLHLCSYYFIFLSWLFIIIHTYLYTWKGVNMYTYTVLKACGTLMR